MLVVLVFILVFVASIVKNRALVSACCPWVLCWVLGHDATREARRLLWRVFSVLVLGVGVGVGNLTRSEPVSRFIFLVVGCYSFNTLSRPWRGVSVPFWGVCCVGVLVFLLGVAVANVHRQR